MLSMAAVCTAAVGNEGLLCCSVHVLWCAVWAVVHWVLDNATLVRAVQGVDGVVVRVGV